MWSRDALGARDLAVRPLSLEARLLRGGAAARVSSASRTEAVTRKSLVAAIAFTLVRLFEFEGRRRASLETFC